MIFLLENRAQDLMTLLIYHHPEERKQTRIPKDTKGFRGKSQKTFLSPNGYPNHHISNCIICSWCNTFKTNHTAKATFKCSTSEKQIPAKTNSRYRNISSPVQNCLHPPVKYENKFQSQNNHDSFNCRPSKSNPHSINQKSVIFGMHKNTSSEC